MEINISQRFGERQNLATIKKATHYFLDTMFTDKELKKIENISIILKKLKASVGCQYEQLTSDQKFLITIELDRNEPLENIIATLAHEMIHAKQMVSGRLQIMRLNYVWEGKSYGIFPYRKLNRAKQIEKIPWETEAYTNQDAYARKFFNHLFDTSA